MDSSTQETQETDQIKRLAGFEYMNHALVDGTLPRHIERGCLKYRPVQ